MCSRGKLYLHQTLLRGVGGYPTLWTWHDGSSWGTSSSRSLKTDRPIREQSVKSMGAMTVGNWKSQCIVVTFFIKIYSAFKLTVNQWHSNKWYLHYNFLVMLMSNLSKINRSGYQSSYYKIYKETLQKTNLIMTWKKNVPKWILVFHMYMYSVVVHLLMMWLVPMVDCPVPLACK